MSGMSFGNHVQLDTVAVGGHESSSGSPTGHREHHAIVHRQVHGIPDPSRGGRRQYLHEGDTSG